jgi:probable HAF family extracellular repeat protein
MTMRQFTLFFASIPLATAGSLSYNIVDLGTLGGPSSFAYGINNSGNVTGHSPPTSVSNTHAFYYDGQMHDLGTLGSSANGGFSAGSQINASNQIVGTTLDATGTAQAFLWDAQHGMRSLGLPNTNGAAINKTGQIVGETASVTNGQVGRAFIWDPTTGVQWIPLLATLPGCFLTNATAVNDASTVTGYCQSTNNGFQAFVWDDAHGVQALDAQGTTESLAFSINNHGQVAGSVTLSPGVGRAVTWNGAGNITMLPLIVDGQGATLNTAAYSINDLGDEVGIGGQRAVLWTGQGGYLLDDLIPQSSGWQLNQANAINNAGQIAGYGTINGQTHAFLLDPVPEANSIFLLGAGLTMLLFVQKRPKGSREVSK